MAQENSLSLFRVTLAWNPNNATEGDYSANVWARNHDGAVRKLAEEMADNPDSRLDGPDDAARRQFIGDIVAGAGPYAASSVAAELLDNLGSLFAGPDQTMDGRSQSDLDTIKAILKQYVAFAPAFA